MQTLLQRMIIRSDLEIKKAQLIKNFPDGQQTMIICPKTLNKDALSLIDIVDITNSFTTKRDNKLGNIVYMKFEIECPTNGIINLKDHLIKYKDVDMTFSHTLENIITFNQIEVSDGAKINIKIFSLGKMVTKTLPYTEHKDRHLIEFGNIITTDKQDTVNLI